MIASKDSSTYEDLNAPHGDTVSNMDSDSASFSQIEDEISQNKSNTEFHRKSKREKLKRPLSYPTKAMKHFFRLRGLEDDEWDVHTIATAPSILETTDFDNASIRGLSDGGYKLNPASTWKCLNGKWRGIFDKLSAPVFLISFGVTSILVLLFGISPELAASWFIPAKEWACTYLGWIFILVTDFLLVSMCGIAMSRYGDIKLGVDDSQPEFSFTSWSAMLFCSGMGASMMFYGAAEPMYTYKTPPDSVHGDSDAVAFERAIPITLFNWGFHVWAIYASLGLTVAYFSARLKLPISMRSACYPALGKWTTRWPGHAVDILCLLMSIVGLCTSVTIGSLQLTAGLSYLIDGVPSNMLTRTCVVVFFSIAAMISVLSGTQKGVRILSNINIFLAIMLLLSVWMIARPAECPEQTPDSPPCYPVEPDGSILQSLDGVSQNFGGYINIIIERSFRTGAYEENEKEYMQNWTIYYFAWYLGLGPLVGTFLAEVSRGRTMRQYVMGTIGLPVLVSLLWFTVFGLFGMNAIDGWTNPLPWPGLEDSGMSYDDWNNILNVPIETMLFVLYEWNSTIGIITESTVNFLSILTTVLLTIYVISTFDSGCLVLSMLGSGGARDPPKWQKIFWCWTIAVTTVVMMASNSDALASLQALLILLGVPMAIFLFTIMVILMITLQYDPYVINLPKPKYEGSADVAALIKAELGLAKERGANLAKPPPNALFRVDRQSSSPVITNFP